MPRSAANPDSRRQTNVTLPAGLLNEARSLGVNVSQACESGLSNAVLALRRERWRQVNKAAIEDWNAHVEEHGLPLEEYRQF